MPVEGLEPPSPTQGPKMLEALGCLLLPVELDGLTPRRIRTYNLPDMSG